MRIRCRPVSLALVSMFLSASACTKWVPLEPPYPPTLEQYEKLQVTDERGVPTVVREPRLEGDTLRGTVVTSYWEHGDLKHQEASAAIPIESVQKIEKRGADVATAAALLIVVGTACAVVGIANMSDGVM